MERGIKTMLYGLAGLGLAIVLSLGAFAVAGRRLSNPAPTITISGLPAHRSADGSSAWTPRWSPTSLDDVVEDPASPSAPVQPSVASPPPDDDATTTGSDDHGGGDDHHGAGDD
jgi:hypothetical protein